MRQHRLTQFGWLLILVLFPGAALPDFDPPVSTSGVRQFLVRGEVNADGLDDLVAFDSGRNPVLSVLLSAGDGTFEEAATLAGMEGRLLPYPAVGDENDDGRPDIVVYSWKLRSKIRIVRDGLGNTYEVADWTLYTYLWPGNGDGTFAPAVASQVDLQQWQIPNEVFNNTGGPGDFNHDGLEDYATLTSDHQRRPRFYGPIIVGLNRGDGTYEQRLFEIGSQDYGLITGDFDCDGWTDVALLRNGRLTTLLNDTMW
jgi:hypothetical protein